MTLSDTRIRSLKPRDKIYRLADAHGLCLEVTPSGSKLWRYRYRWAGKATMLSLGPYPIVGLAEARRKVLELREQLIAGLDPGELRRKPRQRQEATDAARFEAVARAWRESKATRLKPKTLTKLDAILDRDLIPGLGRIGMDELATPEVVAVLEKITARAPHMAQKARSYLNQIVEFAVKKGLRKDGRTLTLRGVVHLPKTKGLPAAINEDALREVMQIVRSHPDVMIATALQLQAYTALRPSNVVTARWSAINLDKGIWRIPGEQMKTGEDHDLPLPRQAMALLRDALKWRRGGSKKDWVFPAISERTTPHMCRDTLSKALRDNGLAGKHVPHGFRASLRTMAREELDADIDALEAQLAHSVGDATQKAYNRARLLKKRVEIMQQWADYLDRLIRLQ